MRKPNTLDYEFDDIPAKMLDKWFEWQIEKYKNTPAAEHYRFVYWMLVAPASDSNDSLAHFYTENEEEWNNIYCG